MANPEHVALLKSGVAKWNTWRRDNPTIRPDLSEADLSGATLDRATLDRANLDRANLFGANLSEANLFGANLSEANLDRAYLSGANLSRGHLSGATLFSTNLTETNFSRANLLRADLHRANFSRANLSRADFTLAQIGWTTFGDVDLSQAINLNETEHVGPSTIGVDTIYKSKGNIPEVFLRGCGVPEQFITYARSLIGQAIEFYSCFISYSTQDEAFAARLHADLQAKHVRCWFAPHDAQRGRKLHEQIDEAIRLHEKLLLILSPNSMQSKWVETEILKAHKREKRDGVKVLFPVSLVPYPELTTWECFDPDTGEDLAREVRSYKIGDFSRWKDHDAYTKELDLLIRDLQNVTLRGI